MKNSIVFVLLAAFGLVGKCNGNEFYKDLFQQANQAYQEGMYDSAITLYSQVVNADYQSKNLYFNLGNAYFKENQLAPAIYYYEKALKLAPGNRDIKFNLQLANSQIVDKVENKPEPILHQLYVFISSTLSSDQWGYLTVAVFFLLLVFITLYLLGTGVMLKRLTFYGSLSLLLIFLVSFTMGHLTKTDMLNKDRAIVFASTLTVKSEPKLSSADLFVIHEGTKVLVLEDGEDWSRIALPDGNEGWVQSIDIKSF